MKRMKNIITAGLLSCALLCGCGNSWQDLPENPIAFETYDIENPADSEDGYGAFKYNNRTYIPYGGMKGIILPEMEYGECLGYLVDEEDPEDKDMRVYPLKDNDDFMAVRLVTGIMEQTMYWRATDTRGKDIEIPGFIEPLGYDYWE